MLTLSIAVATVSVKSKHCGYNALTLSIAVATVSVNTLTLSIAVTMR